MLFASLCLSSCVNRGPELRVTVRLTQDTVLLSQIDGATQFQVSAVVRNDGAQSIYSGCAPEAQRQIEGVWVTVWRPICQSPSTWFLAAADSTVVNVVPYGFNKPHAYPEADPRMQPGLYRLLFAFLSERDPGVRRSKQQTVPSPSFVVLEKAK